MISERRRDQRSVALFGVCDLLLSRCSRAVGSLSVLLFPAETFGGQRSATEP